MTFRSRPVPILKLGGGRHCCHLHSLKLCHGDGTAFLVINVARVGTVRWCQSRCAASRHHAQCGRCRLFRGSWFERKRATAMTSARNETSQVPPTALRSSPQRGRGGKFPRGRSLRYSGPVGLHRFQRALELTPRLIRSAVNAIQNDAISAELLVLRPLRPSMRFNR